MGATEPSSPHSGSGGGGGGNNGDSDSGSGDGGPSTSQITRFSLAGTAHRIIRLTLEVFIVEHMRLSSLTATSAGTVFLVYGASDLLCGLAFLWLPTIFFGTATRGLGSFAFTSGMQLAGYYGLFHSTTFTTMAGFAAVLGAGTASFKVIHKSLMNVSFPSGVLTKLARMRQASESLGFLIPGVCVAVVNSAASGGVDRDAAVIRLSIQILGGFALFFFALSADVMIKLSARSRTSEEDVAPGETLQKEEDAKKAPSDSFRDEPRDIEDQSPKEKKESAAASEAATTSATAAWTVQESVRTFVTTSVFRYFWLNAVILSICNVLYGTASTIAESYFNLRPTDVWLVSVGLPLGSILSFASTLIFAGSAFRRASDRTRALWGSAILASFLSLLIGLGAVVTPNLPSDSTGSRAALFFVALAVGYVWSESWCASVSSWLHCLRTVPAAFVSRANALANAGNIATIAGIFQLQTVLLDRLDDANGMEMGEGEVSAAVGVRNAALMFGPAAALAVVHMAIAYVRTSPSPTSKQSKVEMDFHLPITPPSRKMRFLTRLGAAVLGTSRADVLFAWFSEFWMVLRAKRLGEEDVVMKERPSPEGRRLCPEDFREYLKEVEGGSSGATDDGGTGGKGGGGKGGGGEEWYASSASLGEVHFSNVQALESRISLIRNAWSSIHIITWSLDGSVSDLLAELLIERHRAGVDVKIIVERLELYYLAEASKIEGGAAAAARSLQASGRLAEAGVEVRMLDSWEEEVAAKDGSAPRSAPPSVVGQHRKLMLVDDRRLLTGGRNIADEYLHPRDCARATERRFADVDVLLEGNFRESTGRLFGKYWEAARRLPAFVGGGAPPLPPSPRHREGEKEGTDDLESPPVAEDLTKDEDTSRRKSSLTNGNGKTLKECTNHTEETVRRRSSILSELSCEFPAAVAVVDEDEETGLQQVLPVTEVDVAMGRGERSYGELDFHESERERERSQLPGRYDDELAASSGSGIMNLTSSGDGLNVGAEVDLFELDHDPNPSGGTDGADIIFSSLLFMIETAETNIDLVFGYFQLFPRLEDAIVRALERGVKVRVITNSYETNDLQFYSNVFAEACNRLLEMGAEVYVPSSSKGRSGSVATTTLHHKFVTVDSRAVLVGSWNCIGKSIFYDAEYAVVMFDKKTDDGRPRDDDDDDDEARGAEDDAAAVTTAPFRHYVDDAVENGDLVRMTERRELWDMPKIVQFFVSKEGMRIFRRGY